MINKLISLIGWILSEAWLLGIFFGTRPVGYEWNFDGWDNPMLIFCIIFPIILWIPMFLEKEFKVT